MTQDSNNDEDPLSYRKTRATDGHEIYRLVQRCKPLDLNSCYHYLLLAHQFDETCIVACNGSQIVGYISAFIHPKQPDTLFVWQVAVDADLRGRGVATQMLNKLLSRDTLDGVRYLETTIGPANTASRTLFHSLAFNMGATCSESAYFSADHFGGPEHEDEILFRIGPFNADQIKRGVNNANI